VEPGTIVLVVAWVVLLLVTIAVGVSAMRARGRLEAVRDEARGVTSRAARAEASIAQTEATMAELVELLGVGVVRLDDDMVVTTANAAALAALDRQRERVVGHPVFEAFVDQRLVDLVSNARQSGAAHVELVRGGADGRATLARATRSPGGGSWLTLEDVSELRRLQRIRAEFIDNLSHELRTPLTSLGLLAETLEREVEAAAVAGDPVTPKMRDRLDKIQLETGHLTQMVTEMLELARIEAGGAPSVGALQGEVDMARLVTSSAERLRTFADRSGVRLVVDVSTDGSVVVNGDEDRLGQVLLNLVHNAVKFSPSGSEVVVRVSSDGTEVVSAVIDRGIGIPAEAQARIFERFYKVDRARARGRGGTGLGLAIARHIVEAHGGRIWVDSLEGSGSTFSFALPALVGSGERSAAAAG